jgi:ribosomal protein L11 methyltransferase
MSSEKLTFAVDDRDVARTLAGALQDLVEPTPDALTLFEAPGAGWTIDAYYDDPPQAHVVRVQLHEITGLDVPEIVRAEVPALNWVALSQAALPPVAAGRFMVHGTHDRKRVPRGPNSILIDAGEAFGTAHHATTYGCLQAIDCVTRQRRFANVLDLGCGSGVLAIAVARTLPQAKIIATDMDRQSVLVAEENFRINGVGGRIAALCAMGLDHPALRASPSFDLVIANILADPLIRLARTIGPAMTTGGTLILSGILIPQAPSVIAAYRAQGFALVRHDRVTGWSTLELVRRQ